MSIIIVILLRRFKIINKTLDAKAKFGIIIKQLYNNEAEIQDFQSLLIITRRYIKYISIEDLTNVLEITRSLFKEHGVFQAL